MEPRCCNRRPGDHLLQAERCWMGCRVTFLALCAVSTSLSAARVLLSTSCIPVTCGILCYCKVLGIHARARWHARGDSPANNGMCTPSALAPVRLLWTRPPESCLRIPLLPAQNTAGRPMGSFAFAQSNSGWSRPPQSRVANSPILRDPLRPTARVPLQYVAHPEASGRASAWCCEPRRCVSVPLHGSASSPVD